MTPAGSADRPTRFEHSGCRPTWALLALALSGWALCAVVMGLATVTLGLPAALVVHAVAAPVIFAGLSAFCFRRVPPAHPLEAATAVVALVILLDLVVVAGFVPRSVAMFRSFLGTWLPFALIFAATYLGGRMARARDGAVSGNPPASP